jgi:hypothetical protein
MQELEIFRLGFIFRHHELQIPIDYQIISKTKTEINEKSGKERRVSEKSKNELMRPIFPYDIRI